MILLDQGLPYWRIARRYNANRQHRGMEPVAVSDMQALLPTSCPAVARRIQSFISAHTAAPRRPA